MKISYYTTGEFAKICETTKETLRHYNNIGVIKPEKIESNGYKYYSYHQIFDFYAVTILRHAGCSLEEIKVYLKQEKSSCLKEILTKQLEIVSMQRKALEQREDVLRQSINRFDILEGHQINEIYIEEDKDEYFIITKVKDEQWNESIVEASNEHIQFCIKYGLNIPYQYSYIMHYIDDKEINYIAKQINKKLQIALPQERVQCKKEGRYLKYIHKGIYDMEKIHGTIKEYAKCNNILLDSTYYEREVSIYREGFEDYIIEVAVQII